MSFSLLTSTAESIASSPLALDVWIGYWIGYT